MTFSSWHDHSPWTQGGAHAHAAEFGGLGSSHGGGFGYSQGYGGWMSHSMMGRSAGGFDRMGWGGERRRGHGDGGRTSEQHSAGGATGPCSEQHTTSRAADQGSGRHHGGCHAGKGRSQAAADAPSAKAPAAATTPASAPPTNNAPREGAWDASKGGYVVGQSGEVQIDFLNTYTHNYPIQYRGTDGKWIDLGTSDVLNGKNLTVKADPGSTLQFRMNNTAGSWEQAGTTLNASGKDMAKVTQDSDGYKLAFDGNNVTQLYDDLFLKLRDPRAPS
ncbi:hypothetical protein CDL60_11400 [Roseateles noduli]|nr:hypothetical protein CDL60_11400 [Roseateles noduli]